MDFFLWATLVEGVGDEAGDGLHLRFMHTSAGDGGGAEAEAGGVERWIGVVGDSVVVDDEADFFEHDGGFFAREAKGS